MKQRRFQFRLRTLMVVVTLLAVLSAAIAWFFESWKHALNAAEQQRAMREPATKS
jgi:hypothetical protein